ncbi:4-hydroxybenzoate polyprenyltransferase, mitochondrial-like isoform X2 [Pomacea canaliculata]|uniref:4-hydroxybenzoate polyprenyltransferase, mitochondrial-like isoform X2 n=1 Tax=Pomacea canaliculata TaxID=400727 RepID=UPI000D72AAA4|nr:4-hydroxybenzoate polyprenyltransferase, mitochondrial-like isoform X2 [Pomacea canaliculata]
MKGSRECCMHHPQKRIQYELNRVHCHQPTRMLSFSPKAILEASPPSFQPYLRLIRFDKPIGTMLLLWPCTWSIALAAVPGSLPDARLLALFGAGAFFMRGAGCIINDMWDKDFDKKVERTKLRPLASGELTHFQALVFLASQLSISLGILLQLNTYSILLGAASMILVILYPLAKRYTYWPQVVLGVTLNWGVLLAWSALRGGLEWPVGPLYLACVLHTIFYDTIYSHQDKYDDMLIGVKSTALKLGKKTKPYLAGFSAVMLSCLTATGIMCDHTWPYFAGVGLTGAHLLYQLYTVDLNNPDDCAATFRAHSKLGFILFLGIVLGNLLREENSTPSELPKLQTTTGAESSL